MIFVTPVKLTSHDPEKHTGRRADVDFIRCTDEDFNQCVTFLIPNRRMRKPNRPGLVQQPKLPIRDNSNG